MIIKGGGYFIDLVYLFSDIVLGLICLEIEKGLYGYKRDLVFVFK